MLSPLSTCCCKLYNKCRLKFQFSARSLTLPKLFLTFSPPLTSFVRSFLPSFRLPLSLSSVVVELPISITEPSISTKIPPLKSPNLIRTSNFTVTNQLRLRPPKPKNPPFRINQNPSSQIPKFNQKIPTTLLLIYSYSINI